MTTFARGREIVTNEVDVIVAGAGPVGFLTALGLARAGVEVRVLEAESAINDSPRASMYFPTTVKILDRLGLLGEALEIGLATSDFCYHVPELGVRIHVDTRIGLPADEPYPYNLAFGQHILAQLVMSHLQRLPNAGVLFNHRVVGLAQDSSGVKVSVETPRGREEMRASWLVGADGARSAVRHLLDLPFEGHTWPDRFVATNVRFDFGKYGFDTANMIADPVNWAVVARLGRGDLWRVTYGEDASLPEDEVRRRIPEHYAAILPSSGPYEIVAASPYRVHERCAPRFRVGRALLAGDAAHACNPCGGMGLTTGVIDAMAAADVLTAVIQKRRDESVLDFYSTERRRVFREVSSPLATEFKRRMAERDPEKRQQDVRMMRQMVEDPASAPSATHLAKLLFGEPMPV
jgi:2-polyprenyl-6-methoxyphenol hydroxylase-like FAD-dependent oxidoreductase